MSNHFIINLLPDTLPEVSTMQFENYLNSIHTFNLLYKGMSSLQIMNNYIKQQVTKIVVESNYMKEEYCLKWKIHSFDLL